MAKLNGVKTLDMANGEITKVAYKGAEYAKTNEPVKEGDLFQLRKGHSVIGGEINAFYRTYKDSDGDILIPTSAGGLASIVQRNGYGVAFCKISAQSKPTLEKRVETLESDVAALKGEKKSSTILAIGDCVKTSGISKYGYDCDDMVGVIKENDLENGCYYVKLDSGKGVYLKPSQVKKSEETVDVYEPIEQAKYVPQEGDIVVVIDDSASNHTLGDIGKITEVDGDTFRITVPGKKNRGNWLMDFRFRKATPAEVEKYEQAVKDVEIAEKWAKIGRKPNEFKKGDVVRVLGTCNGHEIAGQLGEIVIADGSNQPRVRAVYEGELIELWTRVELVAPVESLFK